METLTLTLRKAKTTKNKVVYGTADGTVIQSVYIDREALGDEPPGGHPSSHLPDVAVKGSPRRKRPAPRYLQVKPAPGPSDAGLSSCQIKAIRQETNGHHVQF